MTERDHINLEPFLNIPLTQVFVNLGNIKYYSGQKKKKIFNFKKLNTLNLYL